MKQLIPTIFVISLLLFQNTSCRDKSKTNKSQGEAQNSLPGTWRLISYSDFDSVTGKWIQPYGEHPRGYFTYTESVIVNLNVSSDPPFNISQDSTKKHVRPLSIDYLTVNDSFIKGWVIFGQKHRQSIKSKYYEK